MRQTRTLIIAVIAIVVVAAASLIIRHRDKPAADKIARTVSPTGTPSQPSAANIPSTRHAVGRTPDAWADLPRLNLGDQQAMTKEQRQTYLQDVEQTGVAAMSATNYKDAAGLYRAFIEKYPLGPDTPPMMGRLALVQAWQGQFDEAKNTLAAAEVLLGNDRYTNVIEVMIGTIETLAGQDKAAEQRLLSVMNHPIPSSLDDPYKVTPQLNGAPLSLASLYQKQGRIPEANKVLQHIADQAEQLYQSHSDSDWLPSYVFNSYMRQIELGETTDPTHPQRAEQLQAELLKRLGDMKVDMNSQEMQIRMNDLKFAVLNWQAVSQGTNPIAPATQQSSSN